MRSTRTRPLLLAPILVLVLAGGAPGRADAKQPPKRATAKLRVRLRPVEAVLREGGDVGIQVTVTNTSSRGGYVRLWRVRPADTRVIITDRSGDQVPPDTDLEICATSLELRTRPEPVLPRDYVWLEPGETASRNLDLSDHHLAAGVYFVRVQMRTRRTLEQVSQWHARRLGQPVEEVTRGRRKGPTFLGTFRSARLKLRILPRAPF